jgi:ABC-type nitrate/sulfonate/bicarbonate transport system substrate-binding protein
MGYQNVPPKKSGGCTPLGIVMIVLFVLLLAVVSVVGYKVFFTTPKTQPTQPVAQQSNTQAVRPTNPQVKQPTNTPSQSIKPTTEAQPTTASVQPGNVTDVGIYEDLFYSYFVWDLAHAKGFDKAKGLNLDIVHFGSDKDGSFSEVQKSEAISSGTADVLCTTLDKSALEPTIGQIAFFIDQTNGADMFIGDESVTKLTKETLSGKTFGVIGGSVDEFLADYVIKYVGAENVTIISYDSIGDTTDGNGKTVPGLVSDFNAGKMNYITGWTPDIEAALKENGGRGVNLIDSHLIRVPIDIAIYSNQLVKNKPEVAQALTDLWFETLKYALENPDQASKDLYDFMASNGLTDWSFLDKESAWIDGMPGIAQATLATNAQLMGALSTDEDTIVSRLLEFQNVWKNAGKTTKSYNAQGYYGIVNPTFVLTSAQKPELNTSAQPVDTTFTMTGNLNLANQQTPKGDERTVAELPFSKITFVPNDWHLTDAAKKLIDDEVIPKLQASPFMYLKLYGSAALPVGDQFTLAGSQTLAQQRADEIKFYIQFKRDMDQSVPEGQAARIDANRVISTHVVFDESYPRCLTVADNTYKACEDYRFVQFDMIATGY